MKRMVLVLSLALLGGIPARAQTPKVVFPRKVYKVNKGSIRGYTTVRSSQGNMQVACPKETAGPSAPGLHATPVLAYAAWIEQYGGKAHLLFSRSTDGGFTWSPSKEIWNVQVSGTWDFENMILGATFNQVYIGLCTGKWDPVKQTAWPNDIYVMASPDEGKTWLGPTLVNTKTAGTNFDCDGLRMACTYGKAHLAYYVAAIAGGSQKPNDAYYTAVEIKNGKISTFQPERKINNPSAAPGTAAIHYLTIDAMGPLVAIAYADSRVSGSNQGNLYISVSRDMGRTFKETQITKYSASSPRSDKYWESEVAVSGTNIYLVWGGVYGGAWPNNTSFVFSNDMGQTFKGPVILNPGGKGFDTDSPHVAADGKVVCVTWVDDRDGLGNKANMLYAACDQNGGLGFLKKVTEIRLGNPKPAVEPIDGTENAVVRGNRIVVMHEVRKVAGGGEDVQYNVSTDGGKTFFPRRMGTKMGGLFGGSADVDDPRVAMTLNGDVIAFWADDRMSANDLYISGLKLPELTYYGGGKGFGIQYFTATQENNLALILVTEKGTSPPLNLDGLGYTGFSINFVIGQYTPIFAGFTGAYLAVVKNGKALFPNAPDGLGIFNAISLGINPNTLRLTWFTDPVLY